MQPTFCLKFYVMYSYIFNFFVVGCGSIRSPVPATASIPTLYLPAVGCGTWLGTGLFLYTYDTCRSDIQAYLYPWHFQAGMQVFHL